MPLHPNGGKFLLPVETEADVRALFEKVPALFQKGGVFTRDSYRADIDDHFYYIGAVYPQHFRPLQQEVVNLPDKQLAAFNLSFVTWLYLLQDAPDSCVEQLMQRLTLTRAHADPLTSILENMLAAIGTPAALAAVGEYAERAHRLNSFRPLGFWLPGKGKSAEPRFTRHRRAVHFQAETLSPYELAKRPHPVGLPVSFIAKEPAQNAIAWHYLTLDLAQIDGLPSTAFSRIHLVSPSSPQYDYDQWMLFCAISQQNLYTWANLQGDDDNNDNDGDDFEMSVIDDADDRIGEALLLPYDDQLIYCNVHTRMTEDVYGDVGGPPLWMFNLPLCPICRKMMFHVCTVESNLREGYRDNGFRSLFLCEDCVQIASEGRGWN